jgi:hypothetical protein
VKREVQEAQNKLKNSNLSQEEIDELIRRLNVALALLEEALLNIRQLKIENDQLASQVNRLTQEVAALQRDNEALRREIEQLREEIERLKRNQGVPPSSSWNTVRLEWSGCPGAELNLYGASDQPGENKQFSPPPNRTIQQPYFQHDLYLGKGLAGGDTTWVLDRLRADELITFYVKYLNALPGGPLECTLSARWNHLPKGDEPLRSSLRGDDQRTTALSHPGPPEGRRARIAVARTGDRFRNAGVPERDRGLALRRHGVRTGRCRSQAVVRRRHCRTLHRQAGPGFAGGGSSWAAARADGAAAGRAGAEGARRAICRERDQLRRRWVGVLVEPMRDRAQRSVPEALRDLWAYQLREAGAPEQVVDMFRVRAGNVRFDPDALPAVFEKAGVTRAPKPLSGEPAREAFALITPWTEQGVDRSLASTLARLVVEGRLKLDDAKALAALIGRHRDRQPQSYKRTPAGEELQARLDSLHPTNSDVHRALDPGWTKVPPEESLPLVKQITLR